MKTMIFGHKNPDSDSILSAIALSHLKNALGKTSECYRLGEINKETEFILSYFDLATPPLIDNVKSQISDLELEKVPTLTTQDSIKYAYDIMHKHRLRHLAIVDKDQHLKGIVSVNDIAMALIEEDYYRIHTSVENLLNTINGQLFVGSFDQISGEIPKIPSYYYLMERALTFSPKDIVILADVHEMIEAAIEKKPQLIIATNTTSLPDKILKKARKSQVAIIGTPLDIYITSKLITQSNYISSIMVSKGIVKFREDEYLEDVKEAVMDKQYIQFPVISDDNRFLGFMSRRHMLNPKRKQVILVDHNEFAQSADGIEEAEILEIVDHHKIGGLQTTYPIHFVNRPVGSTCTIIFNLFQDYKIPCSRSIAGALLSGILSDTLILQSPTTTSFDREAVHHLSSMLEMDYKVYAMEMFRAATKLEGLTTNEIFYKDYKEFRMESANVGIAQVFTLDFEEVKKKASEFINLMTELRAMRDHDITMILVTDIIKQGSFVYYVTKHQNVFKEAFQVDGQQGLFISGLVSRKKQVLPDLIRALELLK